MIKGSKHKPKSIEKMAAYARGRKVWLGRHLTLEHRINISNAKRGEKNYGWQGGISSIATRIRNSVISSEWRQQIFLRDDFTCQKCGERGGKIQAHHLKSFKILLKEARKYLPLFPLYDAAMFYIPLWNLENGITLCKKCHKKSHSKKEK